MHKQALRIAYKKKRAALSLRVIEEKSMAIANQLLKLRIWDYSFYHLFLSIQQQKEVDTEFILHILNGKDKNVVVSKSDFSIYEMTHFLLTDNTALKVNKWGVPEPVDGIEIRPHQIDVVFVPLLAFDYQGNRIGYGKGFYDRFFEKCRKETLKIGLSFFEAEENSIQAEANDISLDYCVTPKRIYRFMD